MGSDKQRNLGERILIPVFCLISLGTHLPAFSKSHREGDELVYQALAKAMTWGLSNYTTRNHPEIKDFPAKIYKMPLFYHPPLIPFVLKLGGLVGDSAGFFFFSKLDRGEMSSILL